MKPELENLKEYANKISLSSEEKFDMLQNLRTYSSARPVASPYYSNFMKYSMLYASMLALLVGTGATSFAAEGSLPGDILYPIKTNVNEEVIKTLSFSDGQKAKVTVSLMNKRMVELEKMIVTEKDSPEKIDVIVSKLEEHKEDLQEFADQVDPVIKEEVQEAQDIYTELASVIDTHVDILQDIAMEQGAIPTMNTMMMKSSVIADPILDNATTSDFVPQDSLPSDSLVTPESLPSEDTAGEADAVNEIVNFSAALQPLLQPIDEASGIENQTHQDKIRTEVRKRIIENAEEQLNIEVEE